MFQGECWSDVLTLVTPEPREDDPDTVWVAISPELLYSKSMENLLGRLRNPHLPDPPLSEYFYRARVIDASIWGMLKIQSDPKQLAPMTRMLRAEALDVLRLWFTEHLSRAMFPGPEKGRIGLHITPKDLRYRQ